MEAHNCGGIQTFVRPVRNRHATRSRRPRTEINTISSLSLFHEIVAVDLHWIFSVRDGAARTQVARGAVFLYAHARRGYVRMLPPILITLNYATASSSVDHRVSQFGSVLCDPGNFLISHQNISILQLSRVYTGSSLKSENVLSRESHYTDVAYCVSLNDRAKRY